MAAVLDPATRDFNLEVLRGDEATAEGLDTAVSTPPMFASESDCANPNTHICFSGFDPPLMAQGSQAIRESSSVAGEGNSLGR